MLKKQSVDGLLDRARNLSLWRNKKMPPPSSVTRLGDILDFGQLFKAFGNNQFAPIFPILKQLL